MKIVIPSWQGLVSPVFDVAARVLLINIEDGMEISRAEQVIGNANPFVRAKRIAELKADIVICGAISEQLETTLRLSGIEVISNICGQIEEVLGAYLKGSLDDERFLMPGLKKKKEAGNRL